jgi:hypothetical protein
MAYIYRNDNIFTASNDYDASIYITILEQTNCQENTFSVVTPRYTTINETGETFELPKKDGVYKVICEDFFITNEYIYYHYPNLFASLIDSIKESICDCKCDDCEDCDKTDYSAVLTKLLSYGIINDNKYFDSLKLTAKCIKCDVLDTSTCNLLTEQVTGKSDSNKLNKKFIAYYYLVYYYTDLKSKSSTNNIDFEKLYDFKKISKCISKLNINSSCIKQSIYSDINPGIFTVQFNPTFT